MSTNPDMTGETGQVDAGPKPLVVGIDGSPQALAAVDWAAEEADLRQRTLRIVHAFEWPEFNVRLEPPPGAPADAGLRNVAQAIVDDAAARARSTCPGLTVVAECVEGFRRPVLVAEAHHADLMVVGSRGLGSVGALIVGSTTAELAARAVCPVVIVPEHRSAITSPDIVVGVDTSPRSQPALMFALDEAQRRQTTLRVIYVWNSAGRLRSVRGKTVEHEPTQEDAERHLAEFLVDPLSAYPNVDIATTVERGDPRKVIPRHGSDKALVVVGTRGRGTLRGLLLGSVSQSTIHNAPAPVAVIPSGPPETVTDTDTDTEEDNLE